MKDGDIVYCKKDYYNDNKLVFKLGESYVMFIFDSSDKTHQEAWIYCEPNTMPNDYCGFIYSGILYQDFQYFSNYFCTIQEIRKIKLNELYERSI